MMTEALTYLDRAEEWELVVRCYNFLGIASMSRGNPSLALDYYMNGLKDSDTYDLPMQKIMILINMGLLYLECGHYADSENSFLEAYQILQTKQKDEKYNFYMYAFYGNMAECLILQDVWRKQNHIWSICIKMAGNRLPLQSGCLSTSWM